MNGIEALQAIKGHDPKATVVKCSANGATGMVIEAIKKGPRILS
jgi:two-component system chemotaxis response regulator CheY